ncbi:MAG: hypothetical protein JRF33_15070 [Deltaproteobacteria bacterium]|nr:hypothetical protein [Deltaproteobacteria bacterium]
MEVEVGAEHTGTGGPMMMVRHSARQIEKWTEQFGFTPLKNLAFTVYMNREKSRSFPARAYLARKI